MRVRWSARGRRVPKAPLAVLALVVVAAAYAHSAWLGPLQWSPDGLFYRAQTLEVLGRSASDARREVFTSAIAAEVASQGENERRIRDPRWQEYSAKFYRRRWLVPVMGAALDPVLGLRSLQIVSLLGFIAFGPVLFALLRRRFGLELSFVVALACVLLPPVQRWSLLPGVDSWGLTLQTASLLSLVLVVDRGARWLPAWIVSMLALSFTREAVVILVLAAAWLVWRRRRRLDGVLLGTAIAAAALPIVLFAAPAAQAQLAFVIDDYEVPRDPSWGHILRGYVPQLWKTVKGDIEFPIHYPLAPLAYLAVVACVVALGYLLLRPPAADAYFRLHRPVALGCLLVLLLANNFQGYRLEIVLVPSLAVALALVTTTIAGRRSGGPQAATTPQAPEGRAGIEAPP
ncbi:MAG: hypothetical protein M3296_04380 [Actinomycetota bacterium]|nr:hypothetical protein [Actinomycetota bacterium]